MKKQGDAPTITKDDDLQQNLPSAGHLFFFLFLCLFLRLAWSGIFGAKKVIWIFFDRMCFITP